ncbi:hypothetical protein L7F22_063481 [Adiantum nelumboides]|nr:hypothetical protein [Adiantum nelumboides]
MYSPLDLPPRTFPMAEPITLREDDDDISSRDDAADDAAISFLQQQQVTYEEFGLGQTDLLQVFAQTDAAEIKHAKVDEEVEEALDKVYAERDLLQVFAQTDAAEIKHEKVDEEMEDALDKVYVERGTSDGYDSDGYLACYRVKMELVGISTKHMIKESEWLVAPKLRDQIQKLIEKYANNWVKFQEAIVQALRYDEFWEEIHARSKDKVGLVPEDHASSNLAHVNNAFQTKAIDEIVLELAHMAAMSIIDSCEEGENFVVSVPHTSNLCSVDCSQEVQDDPLQGADGPLSTMEECEVKQNNWFLEDDCIDNNFYTVIKEVQEIMESIEDVHEGKYEFTMAANDLLTGSHIKEQDEGENSDASLLGLREENAFIDEFLSDFDMYGQHIMDDFSIASTYLEEVHEESS